MLTTTASISKNSSSSNSSSSAAMKNFIVAATNESSLPIKNLRETAPATTASPTSAALASSPLVTEQNTATRNAAFGNMYYLMIEGETHIPQLQKELSKHLFASSSTTTMPNPNKVALTMDGEWSQPPGAFFSKGRDTVFSLIQIGLKCNNACAAGASGSPSNELIFVLIIDLTKFGAPITPVAPCSSRVLTGFLQWLFNVTADQPRLFFSARNDAALLRLAFGISFAQIRSSEEIIDLQLLHLMTRGLRSVQPESYGRPPFVAYVIGMAKLLTDYRGLAWFAQLKEHLKIRNNTILGDGAKLTYDHFLKRPIDSETLAYTVADAGMLFHLFDEMKSPNTPTAVILQDSSAKQVLLKASRAVATMIFDAKEPKYEDNPCLPLGVFDLVDGNHRGQFKCTLCGRHVANSKTRPCLVCRHMEAKRDWRYD